ncbi:MAG: DNA polymerase III subunit beta [Chitinivibrionales bacterium]|nr:DNA polymerase III subunit beta [Chitinivibrionales bacterium]
MALVIEKKALLDLIQKSYPIVPAKSSLQILSNLQLSLEDGTVEIMATDLDHSIRVFSKVESEDSFEVTVNAKKLFEVVRELHDGPLKIVVDENVVTIESGGSFVCKIAGADAHDFPAFPVLEEKKNFEVPLTVLKDLVQKSSFAVSRDESRACLCGVLWESDQDSTGMVATDGHRLGSCFYQDVINVESKLSGIVSPKSLLHLVRIANAENPDTVIHVSMGVKYVLFSDENFTLCSKLIEGPYPDYDKVIPKNNPKTAVVDRSLMQEAVRRVSVLSNQKTHLVKFSFSHNGLEIAVLNRDIGGEARQQVPIEWSGEEEHVVGFNALYLSEILSIIGTDKVRMEMNTQISACLLFPVYEEERQGCRELFLIMPLRIMEER